MLAVRTQCAAVAGIVNGSARDLIFSYRATFSPWKAIALRLTQRSLPDPR